MAQVYKTFTKTDLDNKQVVSPTNADKIKMLEIITNFIQYIKYKHS
jgi:hypothetical protein